MKYKRKKDDRSYRSEPLFPKNKKMTSAKKVIFALFLLPTIISLLTGAFVYNKNEIIKGVTFVKAVGKDAIMYVSKKFPSLSEVGKKGAQFCFEYIRGEKKSSMPVISTLDVKSPTFESVTKNTEKAIEVKADSDSFDAYLPKETFSPVMPCDGEISSPFGKRIHPLSGEETSHNGIDIAIDSGTEVGAIESGVVQKSEYNQFSGNFVVIEHIDGYTSSYAHLTESKVKEGDTVKKGDVIGFSGSTGAVTGPHLHMEIRKDSSPVDPMTLIKVN